MSIGSTVGSDYRRVLGHLPTGVAVVTAHHDGAPVGMTVGSFTSVSLEPPLVGFFVAKTSSSWPQIRDAGRFCVNVLAEGQSDICRAFAARDVDRFAGIEWTRAPSGSPLLRDAVAWIDCELHQMLETGDHELALGQVTALGAYSDRAPLIFFRGTFPALRGT